MVCMVCCLAFVGAGYEFAEGHRGRVGATESGVEWRRVRTLKYGMCVGIGMFVVCLAVLIRVRVVRVSWVWLVLLCCGCECAKHLRLIRRLLNTPIDIFGGGGGRGEASSAGRIDYRVTRHDYENRMGMAGE